MSSIHYDGSMSSPTKVKAPGISDPGAAAGTQLGGVDLNLLAKLHCLLEEGNVTKAAHRAGVTQSAMSHALRRLRQLYQDALLVRDGNEMLLTARARRLRAPLRQALAGIETVVNEAAEFSPADLTRTFRVAAVDVAQIVLVPALLALLDEEAPNVELEVEDLPRGEIGESLRSGEFDLAICFADDLDVPLTVDRIELFEAKHVCVVREGLEVPKKLSWRGFAALDQVVSRPRHSGYQFSRALDLSLERRGLVRKRRVTVSNGVLIPSLLVDSDSVAILTEHEAEFYCRRYPLKTVRPPFEQTRFFESMLWDTRFGADPEHRWFRDLCRRAAEHEVASTSSTATRGR